MFKFYIFFSIFFNLNFIASASDFILKKIEISGYKNLNETFIIDNIFPYKIGAKLNYQSVDKAIHEMYKSNYFDNINSEINEKDGTLHIKVSENPIINKVKFEGMEKFGKKDINPFLETSEGDIYSKYKIKTDIARLKATYEQFGYFDVKIDAKIAFLDDQKVNIIFEINEGSPYIITEINFIGNENIKKEDLIENLDIKGINDKNPLSNGDDFIEQKIESSKLKVLNKYKDNGFLDAEIISASHIIDFYNKKVFLNFAIKEGKKQFVNDIIFDTSNLEIKKYISEINQKDWNFKKDEIYDQKKINNIKEIISDNLSDKGYPFIKIESVTNKINEEKLDVILKITKSEPIKIRKIEIKGNSNTRDYVIRRELTIEEGDIYQRKKIDISKDRLSFLGYFKNVEIKEKIINENLVDLEITVEEQFFGSVNFSFGYSTFEGIIGTINFQIANILGTGYGINFGISRSGFQESYSVGFFNPRVFNSNLGFGVDLFYSKFGNIDFFGLQNIGSNSLMLTKYINFQYVSFGGMAKFSLKLAERLTYNFGFGYSYYNMNQLRATTFELYSLMYGVKNTYKFNHSISYDRRNYARYATSGYYGSILQEYAGFGVLGNQNYIKTELKGGFLIPFFQENLVFSCNVNFGFTQPITNKGTILSYESMYSMGYYDVRGFSFFGIGPRVQSTAPDGTISMMPYALPALNRFYGTLDLASPLFLPKEYGVKFSIWCDFGTIWGTQLPSSYLDSNGNTETIIQSNIIRVAVGAGISWQSPMGEIRFDFAQPIIKTSYDIPMNFVVRFGTQF